MPMTPNLMLSYPIILALSYMIMQRNHLLLALLFLEMMILSLTFFLMTAGSASNLFYLLVILSFGACEASMGLALLISMTRTTGSDQIYALTINKC